MIISCLKALKYRCLPPYSACLSSIVLPVRSKRGSAVQCTQKEDREGEQKGPYKGGKTDNQMYWKKCASSS